MQRAAKTGTKPQIDKRVRSFVRRAGRITNAQRRALDELWPTWGIDFASTPVHPEKIFDRRSQLIVEIGFGNGELLIATAATNPQNDYIGVEVHEPGVGHCLLRLRELSLTNVRLIRHDAIDVLTHQIPDHEIHGVHLFFPDPWPKKRQHKRRIVQPAFVDLLSRKIKSGGYFHVATDWANYAGHIEQVVSSNPVFQIDETSISQRPESKFERRGKGLGHDIWERIYTRI